MPRLAEMGYEAYLEAMQRAGYDGFLTVEISGRISARRDYAPPHAAARFSHRTLADAFEMAGLR